MVRFASLYHMAGRSVAVGEKAIRERAFAIAIRRVFDSAVAVITLLMFKIFFMWGQPSFFSFLELQKT